MRWGLLAIAAIAAYAVILFNGLVTRRNRVRNAWAQIDVQLRRRADLVPNLVASVQAYMTHERATFEAVAKARARVLAAGGDVTARAGAEAELGASLRSLLALVEAMPDLKASQNMLSLQEELASTENRIAAARQFYNDAVLDHNNAVGMVPGNLVAALFGFRPEPLFEADVASRALPAVQFAAPTA